jgi:hypothetical protein
MASDSHASWILGDATASAELAEAEETDLVTV